MFRLFTHAMVLYVIKEYQAVFPEISGRRLTDHLILLCLETQGVSGVVVRRTEKGKPYVAAVQDGGSDSGKVSQDVFISVSHSGDVFVCLTDDRPVGVDIQKERSARFRQISRRNRQCYHKHC